MTCARNACASSFPIQILLYVHTKFRFHRFIFDEHGGFIQLHNLYAKIAKMHYFRVCVCEVIELSQPYVRRRPYEMRHKCCVHIAPLTTKKTKMIEVSLDLCQRKWIE